MGLLHPPNQSLFEGTIIYVKGEQRIFLDKNFQMAVKIGESDACRGQARLEVFCEKADTPEVFPFLLMKP